MSIVITNDRGEHITQVGDTCSPIWIKRKYPDLLDYAQQLYESSQFPKHPIAIWFFYLELDARQIPTQHWEHIFLVSPFGQYLPGNPANMSPRELLGYLD